MDASPVDGGTERADSGGMPAGPPGGGCAAGPEAAVGTPMPSTGLELLYHEPQKAALCGVHALNTLLQGPYFSEVELANFAQELDSLERQLLAEAGLDSVDFLQHVGGVSANVADDGMFSVQVLSKALEVWGLRAVALTSPEASSIREEPMLADAFICNLREHWFSIRRINDQYWNFNSLYPAPEPLSTFYLSAYLSTLQAQGWTVYWIRGQLPVGPHPDAGSADTPGRWWTPEEAKAAQKEAQQLKGQGFLQAAYRGVLGMASAAGNTLALRGAGSKRPRSQGFGEEEEEAGVGGDDAGLARALAESLKEVDALEAAATARGVPGGGGGGGAAQEDADLAAAIAASLADQGAGGDAGPSSSSAAAAAAAAGGFEDEDEDPELAAALAASLESYAAAAPQQQQQQDDETPKGPAPPAGQQQHVPPQPAAPSLPALGEEPEAGAEGAVQLALRLPGGTRLTRRFLRQDTLGRVAALAAGEGVDMGRHRLVRQFPVREALDDLAQTLAQAGLDTKEMLVVEPK